MRAKHSAVLVSTDRWPCLPCALARLRRVQAHGWAGGWQDPKQRLTMPRVMHHPWVTKRGQWPLRTVRETVRAGDTIGADEMEPEMPDFMSTLNVLDLPRAVGPSSLPPFYAMTCVAISLAAHNASHSVECWKGCIDTLRRQVLCCRGVPACRGRLQAKPQGC